MELKVVEKLKEMAHNMNGTAHQSAQDTMVLTVPVITRDGATKLHMYLNLKVKADWQIKQSQQPGQLDIIVKSNGATA